MSTIDIHSFKPLHEQTFIFDTNILIKLLYPAMSETSNIDYQNLYNSILKMKSNIIVSSVQLSEFVNRCIRFQYNLWKTEFDYSVEFKRDYRNSDDYKNSMLAILEIIKNDILPFSCCIDDQFSKMNPALLYQYGFSYDFNDSLISEIARLNNAILITDDKDYANCSSKITIVTGNKSLLLFH